MRNSNKVAWTVTEFVRDSGIGKSSIYAEIKAGRLQVAKFGRRTLITTSPAEFIATLPVQGEAA